ncbi:MAG: AAA family ATPase [Chloroflexi bacterium]|nr:AAA family ATPase [Chloroflexota bacterium]MBU1662777.1 AAA family ATPase [Chloroflexota bacterium]
MVSKIKSITLQNFLSFGGTPVTLELRDLNVLMGPNGAGKTNLIEAIHLLHNTPNDLAAFLRQGGGSHEWIWKGQINAKEKRARVETFLDLDLDSEDGLRAFPLHYYLEFTQSGFTFEITDERVEAAVILEGYDRPSLFFGYENGHPLIGPFNDDDPLSHIQFRLPREDIDPQQSILAQRIARNQLSPLDEYFASIRLFREWEFGRFATQRLPGQADHPNDFLAEDGSNLGLVINKLQVDHHRAWVKIMNYMQRFCDPVSDIVVKVEAGSVQIFLKENYLDKLTPASRLSDGTLRFLSMLVVLLHPSVPPLVVIEEPELGLHPDAVSLMAEVLQEASNRTQLIITTHSDLLVSAIDDPENIIVCEKHKGATTFNRLKDYCGGAI